MLSLFVMADIGGNTSSYESQCSKIHVTSDDRAVSTHYVG